jgi:hypothetical protein
LDLGFEISNFRGAGPGKHEPPAESGRGSGRIRLSGVERYLRAFVMLGVPQQIGV